MAVLVHCGAVRRGRLHKTLDTPIEIRPGRWGGGVYIKNGFRSDRKYLKPEEKELLQSLRNQLDEKKRSIMDGLLKRLAI